MIDGSVRRSAGRTMFRAAPALAERRASRGLTQGELAAKAGTSQEQVSRFENGRPGTIRTARAIADALGLSLEHAIRIGLIETVRT